MGWASVIISVSPTVLEQGDMQVACITSAQTLALCWLEFNPMIIPSCKGGLKEIPDVIPGRKGKKFGALSGHSLPLKTSTSLKGLQIPLEPKSSLPDIPPILPDGRVSQQSPCRANPPLHSPMYLDLSRRGTLLLVEEEKLRGREKRKRGERKGGRQRVS